MHFARFVIGAEPVQVYGTGSFAAEEQAELSAAITLSFPGGAVAHLTLSYEYGYCEATQRRCSAPTVGSASTCPSTSAAYASRSSWRRRTSRPRSASTMTASTPKSTNSHPGTRNQFDLQLEHLCDAIEKGTLFRIEPEFSLGNMRVLDAIRDSIHTSAPVDVPTLR